MWCAHHRAAHRIRIGDGQVIHPCHWALLLLAFILLRRWDDLWARLPAKDFRSPCLCTWPGRQIGVTGSSHLPFPFQLDFWTGMTSGPVEMPVLRKPTFFPPVSLVPHLRFSQALLCPHPFFHPTSWNSPALQACDLVCARLLLTLGASP